MVTPCGRYHEYYNTHYALEYLMTISYLHQLPTGHGKKIHVSFLKFVSLFYKAVELGG